MKKLKLFIISASFCVFLLPLGSVIAGDGSVLDQSYAVESNTGYGSIGIGGTGQTFTPTYNRVTSIDVYFKHRQTGTSVTMTVKNFASKQVIGSETHVLTFAGDAAWEPFVFENSLVVTPETTYAFYLSSNIDNQTYWMTGTDGVTYSRGVALTGDEQAPVGADRLFKQYGKDVATTTSGTTPTAPTTTKTATKATTIATAPVVAPSVLAVPTNFKVDRNQDEQIVFSWDKNKEADLAGYVMYIYEAQKAVETEIIDIPDKQLDNYNLVLADHPSLKLNQDYDVKLAAKNAGGSVSEKTLSLRVKFNPKATVAATQVKESKWNFLTNIYFLTGIGLLLILLIVLVVYLERKYHGLRKLFKKKDETAAVPKES
ncbi:MAG: fibronectin type III domain-containing protein [Patescibacteria group bacterium]|jgi:hypothetical protein|nr:fibronectin type III domain-containing protein [Patescibacteria group bacterium]